MKILTRILCDSHEREARP